MTRGENKNSPLVILIVKIKILSFRKEKNMATKKIRMKQYNGIDYDTCLLETKSDLIVDKGASNGVASLDENGKIPINQINLSDTDINLSNEIKNALELTGENLKDKDALLELVNSWRSGLYCWIKTSVYNQIAYGASTRVDLMESGYARSYVTVYTSYTISGSDIILIGGVTKSNGANMNGYYGYKNNDPTTYPTPYRLSGTLGIDSNVSGGWGLCDGEAIYYVKKYGAISGNAFSKTSNTFPKNGELNGVYYKYLGKIGYELPASITYGTYKGTGVGTVTIPTSRKALFAIVKMQSSANAFIWTQNNDVGISLTSSSNNSVSTTTSIASNESSFVIPEAYNTENYFYTYLLIG